MESTEHVTVMPADLYDEQMAETPAEPNEALQQAAVRAREVIVHRQPA